ncbi:MAG TPA: UDP-N-acetylmuramoyl-L-alanyl-D-glutamate--2,6-diaminopimelate ligase [Xanthobacteraceae bacterium]|nr:UDP-N-acetylmuramoyl-L-alanyl-D-glutamate--2,6-diaminopimelate ligase [Xanthobacteraceae bacterium]
MGRSFDLREVLASDGGAVPAGIAITGLSADSRTVKPGDIFFALAGSKEDGRKFLADAVRRGAVALVAEGARPGDLAANIPYIKVSDARLKLARAAARFYPRQPATIVAVTGTNGKTSVASFVRQIWTRLGHAAASIGTIGLVAPSGETAGNLTTPDPIVLHALMDKLAGEGVTHLAMEASSHGLEQRRLDGVRLAAAAFTNLTRDHLDYHKTLDAYRAAKLRLFETLLPEGAVAVVDADQPEAAAVAAIAAKRKLRLFGVGRSGADLALVEAARDGFAQSLRLRAAGKEQRVKLPLVGAFQVSNALVAAGLAIVTGGASEKVIASLASLGGASGRLEFVGEKKGAPVFVDYAHTPDALANALQALRPYVSGRLLVVFGAGGDRDAGKRPLMGTAATEHADRVIVTDDNPRSEDPAAIRKAILAAAPGAIEIADRAEAIKTAVGELKRGDVLLVAGKGHESGQIVGDRTLPFSDQAAVRKALGDGS